MSKPRLLDLFCGAGGASAGYARAGFEVTGVDHCAQKRYPFTFVQADAIEYFAQHGHEYDVIHASPPCQRYSACAHMPGRSPADYPDLLPIVRELLVASGKPFALENVVGAPMRGILLCGSMFNLRVYRHRIFEASHLIFSPAHPRHRERVKPPSSRGRVSHYVRRPGQIATVAGHSFSLAAGSAAMGINWMTRAELAEAIPPAYTEYLGRQLIGGMSWPDHRED